MVSFQAIVGLRHKPDLARTIPGLQAWRLDRDGGAALGA
jgi:hypothetical protein